MENIAVLLSTYNGEKWVNEQLDSILHQKNVEVTLYIRDDGSTDKTVSIIKEYKEKYSNIVLWEEENIGWGKSFMELLSRVKGHSFYCFADQDDIWLDNKLNRAIEMINKSHTNSPMLYYSAMTLIDKEGKYIKKVQDYKPWSVGKNKISASCINNLCCGCVMVFNDGLRELCIIPKDKTNISHDTYIGAVAVTVGNIIYDKESFILHRIHEKNATVSSQKRGLKKLIYHNYQSI